MSIYRKIWEQYNNACILPGMHIHHVDGNRNNNELSNLKLCSPEEHYWIHYNQGDYGAASLIMKHNIKGYWGDAASLYLKQKHKEFKENDPEGYSEWQRRRSLGKKRTDEQKENYKKGAAKRCSDPDFSKRLSESCKGKRKIVICPHCGTKGGGGNMRRYHFINCKDKK